MNGRRRKAAMLLAGAVFLGSLAMVMYQNHQYRLGESAYALAEELAGVPTLLPDSAAEIPELPVPMAAKPEEPETPLDPYAEALAATDFDALREVNEDVVGWIMIPDTPISYPLLQGEDNQKYLTTTWQGAYSDVGSIYLECMNDPALSDFNTIVYGHRMLNGSMFASLKYYKKQDYWQEHPLIYVADDAGCKTYAIFAAYEAGVKEPTYRLWFDDETQRQDFLDFCGAESVIRTDIVPETDDRILTLSTCTGRGYGSRWVVQAVLL